MTASNIEDSQDRPPVPGSPGGRTSPRRIYTLPSEEVNHSLDALMRQRPNFTSGGRTAKDGRRVRPRAFRSGRRIYGQGDPAVVRERIRRYGYKLPDLQRVAQKKGRPSNLDALLKDELDLIIFQECRPGFRRLARRAVAGVLGVTDNAIDKAFKRGEQAMRGGARIEARLEARVGYLERQMTGLLGEPDDGEPEPPSFEELVEGEWQVLGNDGTAKQLRRADYGT